MFDSEVDHLVYAAPDLEAALADLERRLGVRGAYGGAHPGRGSHNAILRLGPGTYLEVIAPDPAQPAPAQPRSFGLDRLQAPRLVTWALQARDIDGRAAVAFMASYDPGPVIDGRRTLPDGTALRWRMTAFPGGLPGDGLVPFLIDWGASPHPSERAPGGCALVGLRGVHPQPYDVRAMLKPLGADLRLEGGTPSRLIATLEGPRGVVELS